MYLATNTLILYSLNNVSSLKGYLANGAVNKWRCHVEWSKRIFLFTSLVFASAVAKTAFSKIIACKAYNVDNGASLVSLRTLRAAEHVSLLVHDWVSHRPQSLMHVGSFRQNYLRRMTATLKKMQLSSSNARLR
jgi:hypothetical protein